MFRLSRLAGSTQDSKQHGKVMIMIIEKPAKIEIDPVPQSGPLRKSLLRFFVDTHGIVSTDQRICDVPCPEHNTIRK